EELLSVRKLIIQASVPSLTWLNGDLKAEPPIGKNRLAWCARDHSSQRTMKIPVRIYSAKPLSAFRPLRSDLTAAHDVARFNLEDVGEVGSERDLELKVHRFH